MICNPVNVVDCLPAKAFEYFLYIVNLPIKPLTDITKALISMPVNLQMFSSTWAIAVHIVSMLYMLVLIYASARFMTSGYNQKVRDNAKELLRNVLLMIVLIQASYIAYALMVEISSIISQGLISLTSENFFYLQADITTNIGVELVIAISYCVHLLACVTLLSARYILVASGLVILPFIIFCMYIPPLKKYAKAVLTLLATMAFLPVVCAIIVLVASKSAEQFVNIKSVLMIGCFSLINALSVFLAYAAVKS